MVAVRSRAPKPGWHPDTQLVTRMGIIVSLKETVSVSGRMMTGPESLVHEPSRTAMDSSDPQNPIPVFNDALMMVSCPMPLA